MDTIVVDGYNVMHAIPALKHRIASGDMDQGRKELVEALAVMAGRRKAMVILVFDGVVGALLGTARVRIVSSKTRTADDIIREEARRHGRHLTVVSADRDIVDTARACMAAVWSPEQLATELVFAGTPSIPRTSASHDTTNRPNRLAEFKERSEKPPDVSDDDVDEWKKLFDL